MNTDKNLINRVAAFTGKLEAYEGRFKNTPDDISNALETNHYLAHRVYARELVIPKGARLTGKIHRHSCINIILEGTITVNTHEGERIIHGPNIVVSPPGTKRAGFAHTETRWVTVHHTDQIDPALIEDEVIAENFFALSEPPPYHEPAGLTPIENATLELLLHKRNSATLPTPPNREKENTDDT